MGDSIDDDEGFDYRDGIQYSGDEDDGYQATSKSRAVHNQPHDEEVALSDTESFGGRDDPPNIADASLIESHDMDEVPAGGMPHTAAHTTASTSAAAARPPAHEGQERKPGRLASTQQEEPAAAAAGGTGDDTPGAYNAMEFKHLNVSEEIRTLFQHIGRYKPATIELDARLKPFIPDYIPSVGGLDEFIKVPRPDAKPDFLGLKVVDEPAARQSDPTVLTLQLRQLSKEAPGSKAEMIGRIEHTDEQKLKKMEHWVSSIADIHKSKPAASVVYAKTMPDLELLMQEWPAEMEQALRAMKMPSGDLDLDLRTLTKLMCSILDIPVYDNPIESLHVLFSLYLEFKSNPVFGQQHHHHMGSDHGADGQHGMPLMMGDDMSSHAGASGAATPVWNAARGGASAGSVGMGHIPSPAGHVMTFG